jgi:zinc transport system permease protein
MIAELASLSTWGGDILQAVDGALYRILPAKWGSYQFMRFALLECILLAPICAAIGVKVVNFRMAFFSDAISHAAFAGVALGLLLQESALGIDPRWTLVVFGLLVAAGIAYVRRQTDLSTDTVIGVFFSTVIALGIAIVTRSGARTTQFQRYLYGDILNLDSTDIALTALLAVAVLLFMLVGFNRLIMVGLNDELAHSRGVRVRVYDYLFTLLLALVVTVSIRTAGILLVTALLVIPAATGRNLARSAGGMFWWSIGAGLLSSVIGTLASFSSWLENVGTGAVIVLASAVIFVVSTFARAR